MNVMAKPVHNHTPLDLALVLMHQLPPRNTHQGNALDPSTLSLAFAPRLLHIDGSQSTQQYTHFHSVLRFFLVRAKNVA